MNLGKIRAVAEQQWSQQILSRRVSCPSVTVYFPGAIFAPCDDHTIDDGRVSRGGMTGASDVWRRATADELQRVCAASKLVTGFSQEDIRRRPDAPTTWDPNTARVRVDNWEVCFDGGDDVPQPILDLANLVLDITQRNQRGHARVLR